CNLPHVIARATDEVKKPIDIRTTVELYANPARILGTVRMNLGRHRPTQTLLANDLWSQSKVQYVIAMKVRKLFSGEEDADQIRVLPFIHAHLRHLKQTLIKLFSQFNDCRRLSFATHWSNPNHEFHVFAPSSERIL
ncbi:MAG: hypothetical protein AAFR36_32540, partial [Bacteroidota bacterium]